jgi:hypothetical protein
MLLKSLRTAALLLVATVLIGTALAHGQDVAPPDSLEPGASAHGNQQDNWPHPEFSANDTWARYLLWFILLAFFLPAAIIGPWVRKRVAEDLPELHDREESDALTATQHEPGHSRST